MKHQWNSGEFALLKAAVESANDAVIITDTNLEIPGPAIIYVNPAFTRMTGYEHDEVVGRSPRLLQGKRTSRELLNRLRHDLATKREFYGEAFNYRKDGTEYAVEWKITPVYSLDDEDGEHVEFWVAIQRDVTERRRFEETLKAVNRKKDDFLATLAHELRNPLAPIRSGIQLLRKQELSEVSGRTLTLMNRQIEHIVHLVDDLLDISRINRDKISLKLELFDFASIVSDAVEALQNLSAEDGRRIKVSLPKQPLLINGDRTRVFQIISNLLNNAQKYSEPATPIEVSLITNETRHILEIKDYGVGIDSENVKEVFNMFSQATDVLHRAQGGLGIGLAIVKKLVEMHGGSVWAESEGQGRGSAFYVALPHAAIQTVERSALDASATDRDPAPGKPRKVLVVDDVQSGAELLGLYLESEGFEVFCCFSGASAIEAVETFSPDFILMDLGMPGMNGYEATQAIKGKGSGRSIPVFALTGFSDSETVQQLRTRGFAGHFVKPADVEAMVETLKRFVPE